MNLVGEKQSNQIRHGHADGCSNYHESKTISKNHFQQATWKDLKGLRTRKNAKEATNTIARTGRPKAVASHCRIGRRTYKKINDSKIYYCVLLNFNFSAAS